MASITSHNYHYGVTAEILPPEYFICIRNRSTFNDITEIAQGLKATNLEYIEDREDISKDEMERESGGKAGAILSVIGIIYGLRPFFSGKPISGIRKTFTYTSFVILAISSFYLMINNLNYYSKKQKIVRDIAFKAHSYLKDGNRVTLIFHNSDAEIIRYAVRNNPLWKNNVTLIRVGGGSSSYPLLENDVKLVIDM